MNFRLAAAAVEVPEEDLGGQVSGNPPACSYCGGTDFGGEPEQNGRVRRAECQDCDGTMVSHDGGYWQPDLIGSPHNHPRGNGDPNSGGVPGVWAPVLRREDVTRTARIAEPETLRLLPVRSVGYQGFVEAAPGHEQHMREFERTHFPDDVQHPSQDEHLDKPVGHHARLSTFANTHCDNNDFWRQHGRVEEIDHSQHGVYATQPYVVGHHLDRYLHDRNDAVESAHEHGEEATRDMVGAKHPMVVRHEGNLFAIDGHHRIGSDIQAERPTHALVFDADKHGFPPVPKGREHEIYHSGTDSFVRTGRRRVHRCVFTFEHPEHAAAHALYNHDDGICVATEARQPQEEAVDDSGMTHESTRDPELRLHMVATWADVRNKAKRIRSEGGVHIVVASTDGIGGNVQGDTGVYETLLSYRPGSFKVASWECGCAWAAYAFNRSPAFKRFEGRMCSHALALQFEAQSRGMFGKTVAEDVQRPEWLRDKARQRYLPDTGVHVLVNAKRDPDGLFDPDHGLDLLRPPVYALAVAILAAGHDAAEALRSMTSWGLEHTAARQLVREALHDPMARVAAMHCPDCGAPVPPDADVCPHCHAELNRDDAGLHTAAKEPADDAPTHAGLALKAQDTGRVLMLQRSHKDEDDPARGRWEFPGGGIEPHDHNSLHGAMREFAEEVGQPVPPGGTLQHVHRSGPYVLHTMVIPSEDAITLHDGRIVPNPDDPKGDDAEQAAWWDPEHARKNPALREECKSSPWKQIKEASRGTTSVRYTSGVQTALEVKMASHDPEDLATSPTITRGLRLNNAEHTTWHPDETDRIEHGQARPEDLLRHLDTRNVGDFWHGHHGSVEDAKDYAHGDSSDHPGYYHGDPEMLYPGDDGHEGYHGEVGTVLEAHRPRGWDPNRNPDDGLMGNSYLSHPTELALHKIHYNDSQGNWHSMDATGHTVHSTGFDPEQPRHYEASLRTADYAAGDPLSGVQPNDPPAYAEPNIPGTEENPASTGFATGADPAAFRDAGQPNFSLPQSTSTLHDEPEAALPSTDGADDDGLWDTYVDPAHQHVPLDTTLGRPDPTDGMDSDVNPAEALTPNQVRASKGAGVDAIVQQFQATAGGKLLASGSSDDRSIAEAAQAHLAKTALKAFTPSEQAELISEGAGVRARNFGDLNIEGTHYANLEQALAQYDDPDDVLVI